MKPKNHSGKKFMLGLVATLGSLSSSWAHAEFSGIKGAIHYDRLKRTVENLSVSFDDLAFAAFVCGSGQFTSAATGAVEVLEFLPPFYVGPLSLAGERGAILGALSHVSGRFGTPKYSLDVTTREIPAYFTQAAAQVAGYVGIPAFGFYKMSADPLLQIAGRGKYKPDDLLWVAPGFVGGGAGALVTDAAAIVGDYLWDGKLDQPIGRATEHAFFISNALRSRSQELRKSCGALTKLYRAGREEFKARQGSEPRPLSDVRVSTATGSKQIPDLAVKPVVSRTGDRATADLAR